MNAILALVLAVALAGCGVQRATPAGTGGQTGSTGSTAGGSLSFATVEQEVFGPRCTRCHSGSGASAGLDLSTFSGATNSSFVRSGDAAGSRVFQEAASGRMPLGGPRLTSAELRLIEAWIDAGTPR